MDPPDDPPATAEDPAVKVKPVKKPKKAKSSSKSRDHDVGEGAEEKKRAKKAKKKAAAAAAAAAAAPVKPEEEEVPSGEEEEEGEEGEVEQEVEQEPTPEADHHQHRHQHHVAASSSHHEEIDKMSGHEDASQRGGTGKSLLTVPGSPGSTTRRSPSPSNASAHLPSSSTADSLAPLAASAGNLSSSSTTDVAGLASSTLLPPPAYQQVDPNPERRSSHRHPRPKSSGRLSRGVSMADRDDGQHPEVDGSLQHSRKVTSRTSVRSKDVSIVELSNLAQIDAGEEGEEATGEEFVSNVYSKDTSLFGIMSNFVKVDLAPIWNEISPDEERFATRRALLRQLGIYLAAVIGLIALVLIFPISQVLFENLDVHPVANSTSGPGNHTSSSSSNSNSNSTSAAGSGTSGNIALSGLTFGLFRDVFHFLWKYIVCLLVFPKTLRGWELVVFPALGSLMHCSYAIAVRLPEYVLSGERISLLVQLSTRLAYVIMYYVVDFVALPLTFYKLNEYKGAESNKVRSKKANPNVAGIWILLMLTYAWVLVWLMGVFLTTYYASYTALQWRTLTVILWVPSLPLAVFLAGDFARKARRYSLGYLIAYLWLIEIIPYLTGSYIALVTNIPDYLRFLSSLGFIVLMAIVAMLIRICALSLSNASDTVHFSFPAQFFDNFFGALIFLSSYNVFFVPTILALLIWVTLRNSGLIGDATRWLGERVSFLRFLRGGGEAGRVTLTSQAKFGMQYILSDILTNVTVPILFYVQFRVYLTSNPALAQQYAERFGFTLDTINQVWILFGSTLGSRLLASLITVSVLNFKFQLFNARALHYKMKPISFFRTFVRHINRNSAFFVIMVIYIMNTCLVFFDNVFAIQQTSSSGSGATNTTAPSNDLQATLTTFWIESVQTVLGDK